MKSGAAITGDLEAGGPPAGHGRPTLASLARALARQGRKFWIVAATLAVLAVSAAIWALAPQPSPSYITRPIARGAISRSITSTGSVNPVLTITVGTYVSGVIQSIYCDFNTRVHKGQLCAKIDPRPYQTIVDQDDASLETARAQLAKDQANLNYARANRQRYANLIARNAASQDAFDIADNDYAQAAAQVRLDRASVAQHQAALDASKVNLGYTDIVSPVDGTVVSRNVTMGQTVAASFQTPTLFLIATDLSKMEVDTNVSESDIGGVRTGNSARFTVEAFPDRTFSGVVTQVRQAPQTVQNVVTYDVVITVPNSEFLLKPGMTATVRIVTDERKNVLRVPNQALRYTPGGLAAGAEEAGAAQVWVLRNGKPQAVPVTTGLDDDNYTEITGGELRSGDAVIVSERASNTESGAHSSSQPRMRF